MREVEKISRTENLKRFVAVQLKKVCENVCYEQATNETPYPYLVYSLNHKKNEVGYSYFLEINVWDKNISTKPVEAITDSLEKELDETYYTTDTFAVSIDLNTRNTIEDADKSLKRRRLLFDLSYFN